MREALRSNIRKVVPYVPGEQPKDMQVIKLNTNENPYPPAPGVQRALSSIDAGTLRLYPDPAGSVLVNALASFYGVSPDWIFTGVGSDDVLSMSFLTFFNSGKPILFPNVTYSFYDVWAGLYHIPYKTCKLGEDMRIRPEDYMQENGGIVIPNPNAPTGIYEPLETFECILEYNQDTVVIIDEAYIDFADGPSARALLEKYPNLLVVQTFSKSRSMAGMRIGYAIGNPELIKALSDVKYSFNSYTMSTAALLCGAEAVYDREYFECQTAKIKATRERTKSWLAQLGFSFPDSQSNFIFAAHKGMPAKKIFKALKDRHIYVRYFDKPGINNYLRITIGTDTQMEALRAALEEILGAWKRRNIVLIGMPGAGKSTVGVVLAKKLGYRFLDSDLVIQEKTGKLLHELITEHGVEGFLEIEGDINAKLECEKAVIATGGSVVYEENAMNHLKSLGTVVYLKLSYKEIEERLGDLKERGVALKQGQTLKDLYDERCPLYEKYADATLDCNDKTVREIVDLYR